MSRDEPISPEHVADGLRGRASGATLLVGPGQHGPGGGVSRVCVLALAEPAAPQLLWDGPVADAELPRLRELLGRHARVLAGELETRAAPAWSLAWTSEDPRFCLYRTWGRRCSLDGDRLRLRERSGDEHELQRAMIVRVLGWVAPDWVLRGVSVELVDGEMVVIAKQRQKLVLLDPTYNGFDLDLDCAWIIRLGRSLAGALGVAYVGTDPAVRFGS